MIFLFAVEVTIFIRRGSIEAIFRGGEGEAAIFSGIITNIIPAVEHNFS